MSTADANSFYNNREVKAVDGVKFIVDLKEQIVKLPHASGAGDDALVISDDNIKDMLKELNIKSRDKILKRKEKFFGTYLSIQNFRFALWFYTLAQVVGLDTNPLDYAMIKDIRKSLVSIKSRSQWYNGLDQSCGLANLDSIEDELLYIKEWSEISRDAHDIPSILKTIEEISVQNKSLMYPTFRHWLSSQSISELLTSGSLGLNGDKSEISRTFKKYFDLLEDRDELKVNSKKALLLIPEQELIDALEHDVLNSKRDATYNVVSARDYNKARYIVNSDIVTYFAMKYLYENSEKTKTYRYGNMKLHLSSLLSNTEFEETYYKAVRTLRKGGVVAGMDYTRFDFQPIWEEIEHVLRCFFTDCEVLDSLIHVIKNSTRLRNIRTGIKTKYKKGIMSGWFLTSWLDSIINICWFVAAAKKNDLTQKHIEFYVLGDDSLLICDDMKYSQVDSIVSTLEKDFGLNINVDKTEKGNGVTYLRHVITKDFCNGLPLRAVNPLLTFNEKNASEYVANHSEDFNTIDTGFSILNKLCTRLNVPFSKSYFYEDLYYNKNVIGSIGDKIGYVNYNKIYGGCGYPLGDNRDFSVSVEIVKWRGELRGEAFAQGGIRYRKDPFEKVLKKVVGKKFIYDAMDYNVTYALRRKIVNTGRYMIDFGVENYRVHEDTLFQKLLYEISILKNCELKKALDVYRFDRNEVARMVSRRTGLSKARVKKELDSNGQYVGFGWTCYGLVDRAQKLVNDMVNSLYTKFERNHVMQFIFDDVSKYYIVKV